MKHTREFEIAWQGLKEGIHEYDYTVTEDFIKNYGANDQIDFDALNANIKVQFEKHSSFFQLKFDIDGHLKLPCDRCGDEMELKLWDEFKLIIKLVDEMHHTVEEEEDDVAFIPKSETVIDLGKWIYEYLVLSIPLHRIHPDGANGQPSCNPETIKLLEQLSNENDNNPKPIWKGLENIKIDKK